MQVLSPRPEIRRLDHAATNRAGFTLLELMIVIVIIAILMALLLPAVNSIRRTARDTEVRSDISRLEQSITQFKLVYGIEPPSQITLYAVPAAWDATVNSKRSKGLIRQLWPKFDFGTCGGAAPTGVSFPLLGAPAVIDLNGAECLVFFLGGMIDNTSGGFVGFSKNPVQPFAVASGSGSREGPFFEFKGAKNGTAWKGRLVDVDNDEVPEYMDTLPQQTKPYAYFRSNDAGSYAFEAVASLAPLIASWRNTDCLGYVITGGVPTYSSQYTLIEHAYYQTFVASDPMGPAVAARKSSAYKPKSFQIISPGADGLYGSGGPFDPTNASAVPKDDKDNITNFHSGRLGG